MKYGDILSAVNAGQVCKYASDSPALFGKQKHVSFGCLGKFPYAILVQQTSQPGIDVSSDIRDTEPDIFFCLFFRNSYKARRTLKGTSSADNIDRHPDEECSAAPGHKSKPMRRSDRYRRYFYIFHAIRYILHLFFSLF